jgi:hypothetical protein
MISQRPEAALAAAKKAGKKMGGMRPALIAGREEAMAEGQRPSAGMGHAPDRL